MTTSTDLDDTKLPLPALTERTAGTALPPPPGLRVMCVDDNVDAADSLGTLLGMVGCKMFVAHDAKTALAGVDALRPQVCLLDITMPDVDGCELAHRLRELPGGPEMLLIALTALGDFDALTRMADAGFDLHYVKPIQPQELYAVLNDFTERGSR